MLSITRGFERGLELGGGGVFSRLWAKRPEARAKLAWLTSSDLSEAQLEAHMQVARYGDFVLTDAIRPSLT